MPSFSPIESWKCIFEKHGFIEANENIKKLDEF